MCKENSSKSQPDSSQFPEIDAIRGGFQKQLKANDRPAIEDFVADKTEPFRSKLLETLLLAELEYLDSQNVALNIEEYLRRFPADESLVRQIFARYQQNATTLQPGQLIGHYQLGHKLGAGGMGEVYLARDTRLDRQVAIKLMPLDLASDASRRQRFLMEAKSASALNHANVCVIYEVGETEDQRPFIAMELVEGHTLDELVRTGTLEISRIVEIATQIADALAAAHAKRIVHRDIKPSNICLNERGQVKVLDFGLAKRLADLNETDDGLTISAQTQSGTVLGTPGYMSPEQALGKEIDHRTDIFSLGVVLYQLVTGRPPFQGSSFGDVIHKIVHSQPEAMARFNYSVTPELDGIIRKCLQKLPERRYQTADELLVDLKNISHDSGIVAESMAVDVPEVEHGTVLEPGAGVEDVRQSDIFISCAQLDDQPLSRGKPGWITRLRHNLKVRLEQLSGESVRIHTHPLPPGPAVVDQGVIEHLPNVSTLVSVISPPFAKSEGCRREVEEFCDKTIPSGRFWIEDKPRLFKVVKTPVDDHDIPERLREVLQQLMAFEFFERDPETGRFREFDEAFGEDAQQQYYEKVYDLAYDIAQVLKHRKAGADHPSGTSERNGLRIYLAETTSDVQADRDRLRRELLEQGHAVMPDRPLPLVASEIEAAVNGYLDHADLAIHMIGARYGLVPEDSDRSVVSLQNAFAANRSAESGLKRLIWLPKAIEPSDQRQSEFIRHLIEDETTHQGADVVQDTLENLKEVIESIWESSKQAAVPKVPSLESAVARVYLICDQQDETDVEPLEDYLYEQGIEVSLPDFERDEEAVSQIHWRNLQDCDAALIYYGAGSKSWVDIKLRDLVKAVGYRNGLPLHHQAVFIAPPIDRRKERFKSLSAEVIRQSGDRFEPGILSSFADRVKQTRQAAS